MIGDEQEVVSMYGCLQPLGKYLIQRSSPILETQYHGLTLRGCQRWEQRRRKTDCMVQRGLFITSLIIIDGGTIMDL